MIHGDSTMKKTLQLISAFIATFNFEIFQPKEENVLEIQAAGCPN